MELDLNSHESSTAKDLDNPLLLVAEDKNKWITGTIDYMFF